MRRRPCSSHGVSSPSRACSRERAQRFTMFLESGVPVRAQLQVTFNEFVTADEEAKEVNRQTADFSRMHVIGEGETLSAIAHRAYGDPRKWRPIAIANGLDRPRRLPVGLALTLPAAPLPRSRHGTSSTSR